MCRQRAFHAAAYLLKSVPFPVVTCRISAHGKGKIAKDDYKQPRSRDVADYISMTKRQLMALVEQVHQNFGELHVRLPMVIFPPAVEILKGLYFESSGSDASCFYAWVFFMPLCIPSNHVTFNLGRRIGGTNQRWDFNDPLLHKNIVLAIRAEAIPFLSQAQTPHLASKFALSLASSSKSPYSVQASAYLLARSGDVAAAINSLETLLSSLKKDVPWQLEMAIRAEKLKSLLIENTDQAIWQLKEWELETKQNLKIDA